MECLQQPALLHMVGHPAQGFKQAVQRTAREAKGVAQGVGTQVGTQVAVDVLLDALQRHALDAQFADDLVSHGEQLDIRLAVGRLVPWTRWITPRPDQA